MYLVNCHRNLNSQYHIETAHDPEYGTLRPIGLVTWAKVSDELDERLTSQKDGQIVRLRPAEWNSGEHYWLVDVVGTSIGIAKALNSIKQNQLSELIVKVPLRDAEGKLIISNFDDLLNNASETGL